MIRKKCLLSQLLHWGYPNSPHRNYFIFFKK